MPAIRGADSKTKTRRRTRDIDQVYADIHDVKHLARYKKTKAAEDLPGLGQHYCVECAKWFEAEYNLVQHRRGKPHKRRLRQLKEEPYTQAEAEAAAGYRILPKPVKNTIADPQSTAPEPKHDENRPTDYNDDEEYDALMEGLETVS